MAIIGNIPYFQTNPCMNHWWNISDHLEHPPYTEVLTHWKALANEHNWNLPISDRHRNMWERCCVHPSSTDWILWEWSFTSLVNGCFLPNGGYLWQDYRKWQLTSQTNPGCWSNMALPSFADLCRLWAQPPQTADKDKPHWMWPQNQGGSDPKFSGFEQPKETI